MLIFCCDSGSFIRVTLSNLAQQAALQDLLIPNIGEIQNSLSEEYNFVTFLIPVGKFRESNAHQPTNSGIVLHTKLQIHGQHCTPSYRFRNITAHQATVSGLALHTKLQIQVQYCTPSYRFRNNSSHQATNSGIVLHTNLQIRPSTRIFFLAKLFAFIVRLDVV